MKFIHISDLHFGKNLFGYSMVTQGDQKYWADQFLALVDKENPDAVIIAGDVYDRAIPSKDAVELLDWFITSLAKKNVVVLMIAGNHDSGTRLSFGSNLLSDNKVYIAGEVNKDVKCITLHDDYGPVNFWLVPYLFPAAVQVALEDPSINSYDLALRRLLEAQSIDYSMRNVIVSHQTVMNKGEAPEVEGSETMIGGIGEIEVSAYQGFDYAALGHIHAVQKVGQENIRYSGSPLCYHFGELRKANKGPVIVELKEKGNFSYRIQQLTPLHPLREIKGTLNEILETESNNNLKGEYIRVVITDQRVPMDARSKIVSLLELKDSKLMEIVHEPKDRFVVNHDVYTGSQQKSIDELFVEFYRSRNNDEFPSVDDQELISLISQQVLHVSEDEKIDQPSENDISKIIELVIKQEEKQ